MQSLKDIVKELTSRHLDEVIGWRRHLHRYPELSTREYDTSGFIASTLNDIGVPFETGVAGTGIVGILEGINPKGKVVALRADMDALPITEESTVEYKSMNPGIMHACGHDAHMAVVLGAARVLSLMRTSFNGMVKLIFQPSEETYPGGAIRMIEEGVLENPRPDVIIGEHVFPELDAGMAGFKAGKYMASTDEFFITIKGKGGHAAIPDQVVDPVLIASHIVLALQQIVSRNARPSVPTVVSIGRFIADGRTNVIPDEVSIEGIIRTFDETWREEIRNTIKRLVSSISESMGGSGKVRINPGYPYVENNREVTERMMSYATEFLGEDKVVELEPRMTAEDFAYYLQKIPGTFYRLGVRNRQAGIVSNLHTPTFDIDETSLETGVGLMAWLTIKELTTHINQ
jgi:amidohydrolase